MDPPADSWLVLFLYLSPAVIREISQRKGVEPAKKFLLGNVCWIESVAQPCVSPGVTVVSHLTPAGVLSIPRSDAFHLHLETPREGPGTGLTLDPAPALASF